MKMRDMLVLGYKKSIHNLMQNVYISVVLSIAFTTILVSQLVPSGAKKVVETGLSHNSIIESTVGQNKYIAFEELGGEGNTPIPKDIDTYIKAKKTEQGVKNIFIVQSYIDEKNNATERLSLSFNADKWQQENLQKTLQKTPTQKQNLSVDIAQINKDQATQRGFSFVDDEILKDITFDGLNIKNGNIPIYVYANSPVSDNFEDILNYNLNTNSLQKYNLTLKSLQSKFNQGFDLIAYDTQLANGADIKYDIIANRQKLSQKGQIAGRFTGIAQYISNGYVIPMSYKNQILSQLNKIDLPLQKMNIILSFDTATNRDEYTKTHIAPASYNPVEKINQLYYPYQLLSQYMGYLVAMVCVILVIISIYRSILANSHLVAMLSCLGCGKWIIGLINFATLVVPIGVSIVVSVILSIVLKLGLFWVLSQGFFFWLVDDYTNLGFVPDLGLYMSFDVNDYVNIFVPFGVILLVIFIIINIAVSKIEVIKLLKD